MTTHDLATLLPACGQGHLLQHLEALAPGPRARLERELAALDLPALSAALAAPVGESVEQAQPYPWLDLGARATADARAIPAGEALLRAGKVAALVMAGGSGTRLGWSAPKGTLPVLPVSRASLFEVHARKVAQRVARFRAAAPLVLMLSDETRAPTQAFFQEHRWFGLSPRDVLGFCQGTLPAVDQAGRLLLAGPDRLASFPDGHGGLYRALLASGTLDALEARGVEHLFVFQVDNPLVPVLDPAFLGHHALAGSEFSFLAVRKAEPREKVAVFASQPDGCPVIVEYLDLPERFVRESERFCAGNIAIYAISCGFARRVALEGGLPVHRSLKKVPHWEPGRGLNTPGEPNAFKLECFLFDALPRARRHLVVEFEREAAFAPIKNPTGVDSAESAARLLRRRALALLAEAGFPAGEVPPGRPVELAPGFLVDPGALRERLLRGPRPEPSGAGPLVLD